MKEEENAGKIKRDLNLYTSGGDTLEDL
jgi:hypothetical protein